MDTFELKREHVVLLRELEWAPGAFGTPEADQKRPYGNSGRHAIAADIATILGWESPDDDRALQLFGELSIALKIILQHCFAHPRTLFIKDTDGNWKVG